MVAFCDIRHIPAKDWSEVKVETVAVKNAVTAHPDQSLGEILELMGRLEIDRMPVVDPSQPEKIIGVIANTDIIRLEEISEMLEK